MLLYSEIPLWELSIEKETVASGRYSGEAKARQELSRIAFEDLKKTCFSILRVKMCINVAILILHKIPISMFLTCVICSDL